MENMLVKESGTGKYRRGVLLFVLMVLAVLCLDTGCSMKKTGVEAGTTATGSSEEEDTGEGEALSASRDVFAMDTYMTLTAYGEQAEDAVDAAAEEIKRLDTRLSAENKDSEVYIVNHNGSEILSEDTAALVQESVKLYRDTEGAFDITVYPLMVEWGFTTEKYKVPEKDTIRKLLENVDASRLEYDAKNQQLTLPEGIKIDLGGIAKGYTSGKVMEIFQKYDITSGLVSLGGNVQVLGLKTDGSKWRVAIQDPEDPSGYIGVLQAEDQCVITSGGYERYFEEDGKVWHHILDPSTGYSADSGLVSVSIVSNDGMLADGLSTSLFIMGKQKALEYWEKHSKEFDAILVEEDGTITVTKGISEDFSSDRGFEVYPASASENQ